MTTTHANADPGELEKFSELAHRWWDPNSEFKPLHEINPLRLDWIQSIAPLAGKRVVDVGCGGGILSESMARAGANVKGIDLSRKALRVADLHGLEAGIAVEYEEIAAEALAARLVKDKKTIQSKIHFVLPVKIGEVTVRSDIGLDQATRAIEKALADCR